MKFTSPMRQLAALALTAVFLTTAALSGFAVYAMPIQAAYPQESIYLFDADTGETLVEQNPDLPRCVASLTKMMTALLVLESGTDLNASITIPDSLTPELQSIRANRGHTIGLQAGETVRRIDMMYAMLLPSANDAASVLANDTSGSLAAFAAQMNVRASQLGCTATHFTCPHGLYDGGNYSTARDMAKIALACYANPTYRQIADTASYRLPATELHPARTITTTNKLLQPASGYYRSYDLTIPAAGWKEMAKSVGRYWYSCDVAIEGCDSSYVPMGTLTLDTAGEVEKANLATVLQTVEGGVRFYAAIPPKVNIRAFVTLFAKGTASMQQASAEEVQRMLDEIFNG